jgi:hypothetical protein
LVVKLTSEVLPCGAAAANEEQAKKAVVAERTALENILMMLRLMLFRECEVAKVVVLLGVGCEDVERLLLDRTIFNENINLFIYFKHSHINVWIPN